MNNVETLLQPEIIRSSDERITLSWPLAFNDNRQGYSKVYKGESFLKNITQLTNVDMIMSLDREASVKIEYRIVTPQEEGEFKELSTETLKQDTTDCMLQPYRIELRLTHTGKRGSRVRISELNMMGTYDSSIPFSERVRLDANQTVVMEAPYILKVLSLEGFDVLVQDPGMLSLEIMFSQDNGRSWSQWIPMTQENLQALNIEPLRFFEYKIRITNTGDQSVNLEGVDLIGEFINVTENYSESNRAGVRADCAGDAGPCGDCDSTDEHLELAAQFALPVRPLEQGEDGVDQPCQDCDSDDLWNPFDTNFLIKEFEFQAQQANAIAGIEVDYFYTQPDNNAIDHFMNEQQLHEWSCYAKMKVVLPDGRIPDGSDTTFNVLDLLTFNSFTVHILRQEFKSAFGPQTYPRVGDAMRICILNEFYEVQHAYAHRGAMGASVHYVANLVKFQNRQSIQHTNQDMKNVMDDLLGPSSSDEVKGRFEEQEKKTVANLDQHRPMTRDQLSRNLSNTTVQRLDIEHGPNIISKYHYDLTDARALTPAIRYNFADNNLAGGQNRCFMAWFKMPGRIDPNASYNVWNASDGSNGLRIDVERNMIKAYINSDCYDFHTSLVSDVWWAMIFNMDQTSSVTTLDVYRRMSESEPYKGDGEEFIEHASLKQDLRKAYSWQNTPDINILGSSSEFLLTNLRLFNSIVKKEEHFDLLTQNIVYDARHLMMADNAEPQFDLTQIRPENW